MTPFGSGPPSVPETQPPESAVAAEPRRQGDRVPARLAIHVFDMRVGGVAISTVHLASALARRGHHVDLLLCRTGPVLAQLPNSVKVVKLRPSLWFPAYMLIAGEALSMLAILLLYARQRVPIFRSLLYVPALVRYLRRERPRALMSAKTVSNLVTLSAAKLARVPTRIVVSERIHLSAKLRRAGWSSLGPAIRRTYPAAHVCVACSEGVAEDVSNVAQMPRDDVVVIYSPVVHAGLAALRKAPLEHPWFVRDAPPVILGVGRLEAQKDFATLLKAFARVRSRRPARLVVLGEGRQRSELQALAGALGVAADVDLAGGVRNPHAYMARAAVFAMSSRLEGLSRVVVEALAAGCPVVSTDCASGPAEVLGGGVYGRLVPVGDSDAFAEALLATLDEAPSPARLQGRAGFFSVERSAERHLDVMLGEMP